jgi:peroxiredoxin
VKAKNNAVAELKALAALLDAKKSKADKTKLLEALKDTDVPKDRLARYWLKLDDKTKAFDLTKNFTQDLAGLAAKTEVLQACGKTDDAKKAFEETRKLAFAMDRDLPVAKRSTRSPRPSPSPATGLLPAPKRTDSGTRPSIESLGPVHWHPPAAPVFEALTLDNKPVKSTDFSSKKPTLFMFYLGHECGHCVEQIQAFSKAAADFDKAGIQLVAVTIEPTPVAKNIRAKLNLKKDAPLPFPILCDSSSKPSKPSAPTMTSKKKPSTPPFSSTPPASNAGRTSAGSPSPTPSSSWPRPSACSNSKRPRNSPASAQRLDEQHGGKEALALDAGGFLFGAEHGALRVEHFVIGHEAGVVAFLGEFERFACRGNGDVLRG